jgi:DNA-binding IclR family transcriptional regulator
VGNHITSCLFPLAGTAAGRVLTATLPDRDANPANDPVWTYAYDPAGNVTATTPPTG